MGQVSLKLIVRGMLRGCPEFAAAAVPALRVPHELPSQRLCFHTPPIIVVSEHNPGARQLADALHAGIGGNITVTTTFPEEPATRTKTLRIGCAAGSKFCPLRLSAP